MLLCVSYTSITAIYLVSTLLKAATWSLYPPFFCRIDSSLGVQSRAEHSSAGKVHWSVELEYVDPLYSVHLR